MIWVVVLSLHRLADPRVSQAEERERVLPRERKGLKFAWR